MENMEKTTETATKAHPICRTCLNVITGISYRLHENSGIGKGLKFTHILRYIVPELYLGLSNGPEICFNCKESLRIAFTFRKKCLETETLIGNYLKNVRYTAQVIELSAVIDYLSGYKLQQTAQNILSEWNDDSCEDFPYAEAINNVNMSSVPSKFTITPEINMVPIPNTTLPVPEINTIPTAEGVNKPSPMVIKKIVPNDSKIVTEVKTEPDNTNSKQIEANKENSKDASALAMQLAQLKPKQRVEVLKVCPQTGLFKNKAGKYFNLKGELLTDALVEALRSDRTNFEKIREVQEQQPLQVCESTGLLKNDKGEYYDMFGKQVECNIKKEKPEIEQNVEIENRLRLCKGTNLLRNKKGDYFNLMGQPLSSTEMEKYKLFNNTTNESKKHPARCETQTDNTNENSLNVCEETGLLKDQNGHYFDFSGNPLEEEQVEAERNKAKIRGENLFQISNICTVTDEDFENPVTSASGDVSRVFEGACPVPGDTSQTQKPESFRKVTLSSIASLENSFKVPPPIFLPEQNKNLINALRTPASQPINILNFMADKNLMIPQQWNPNLQVSKDPKIKNTTSRDEQANNSNFVVKIKQEPLDQAELVDPNKYKDDRIDGHDNEDTISTSDLNSGDGDNEPWKNLIDSIDSYENSQYVDVPDFIHINNFTVEDLEDLRNETQKKEPRQEKSNPMKQYLQKVWSKKIPTDKGIKSVNRNKTKPRVLGLSDKILKATSLIRPGVFKMGKTNAEICKNYYHRKKAARAAERQPKNTAATKKSGAERTRAYRMRKKMLGRGKQSSANETLPIPSTSNSQIMTSGPSAQPVTTATRRRRPRLKIVPVNDTDIGNTTIKSEFEKKPVIRKGPDREVCVLFTNYSENGLYINDHDYLIAPYIRNKLLIKEEDKSYCLCFICGNKHGLHEHITHMKTHDPQCPHCNVNLGTAYMLNLHIKGHSKPCRICTEIIPYSNIHKHAKKHAEEEELLELKANARKRKRNRNDVEDDMEVSFPLIPRKKSPRTHFQIGSRNTRNRSKPEESGNITSEAVEKPNRSSRITRSRKDEKSVKESPTANTNSILVISKTRNLFKKNVPFVQNSDSSIKDLTYVKEEDEEKHETGNSVTVKIENITETDKFNINSPNKNVSIVKCDTNNSTDIFVDVNLDKTSEGNCSIESPSKDTERKNRKRKRGEQSEKKGVEKRVLRSNYKKKEECKKNEIVIVENKDHNKKDECKNDDILIIKNKDHKNKDECKKNDIVIVENKEDLEKKDECKKNDIVMVENKNKETEHTESENRTNENEKNKSENIEIGKTESEKLADTVGTSR